MLLIDVSYTAHCRSPTGIQRVSRGIWLELDRRGAGVGVCFDRWQGGWRRLRPSERRHLEQADRRGLGDRHHWSAAEIALGAASRILPRLARGTGLADGRFAGLLVPEKLESRRGWELERARQQVGGPSVAVFHDLLPVQRPSLVTRSSAASFPRYLETLRQYDGIAAVSEASRQELLGYWEAQRVAEHPPVEVITPAAGLDWERTVAGVSAGPCKSGPAADRRPEVLMVATLEPRKNHLAVLTAAETLWSEGAEFSLSLVGRASRAGGAEVLRQLRRLQAAGRPARHLGHVGDAELAALYRECAFTVHPSLYEGYGLPVLESLAHAKPCVVSDRGALAETARGGGCLVAPGIDAPAIAGAMRRLLRDRSLYERLVRECGQRRLKGWTEYCDELLGWMAALARRG